MQRLSRPGTLIEAIGCPFTGPGYQVIRNIATAAELGSTLGVDWRAVFAFPASRQPEPVQAVEAIRKLLLPRHAAQVTILDYTLLAAHLADSGIESGHDLARYMKSRLEQLPRP